MRKYLILFLLAFMQLQSFAAEVVVTVGNLAWGEKNELVISMNNDAEVNGFQLDLALPDGFSFTDNGRGDVAPTVTERLEDLTVMCRKLPSGKYRIVVFSMSGKKIVSREGVIMRIPLAGNEGVSKGRYEVRVLNASASVTVDGKMESAKIAGSTSFIEVK